MQYLVTCLGSLQEQERAICLKLLQQFAGSINLLEETCGAVLPVGTFMGILSRQPSRVKAIKNRLYELIDRATSEFLSAPNFAASTDVVSAVTGAPDPSYAATKACKRIRARLLLKNPRVQQLALQLLENCVRSCGESFHKELAKSELFVELLHLADKTSWCTAQLQTQVLGLLQEWAYALKPAQFSNAYNKLKARGLPFPQRNGALQFEPYPGLSPPPPLPPGHVVSHSMPRPTEDEGPPQLLSPSQPPAKLKEDLAVARNTVSLLQEMLDGVPQDSFGSSKEEYVLDMVAQCREMKERLTRLISRLSDEELMMAALQLNDDAQAALDRHADMVAVAEGRRRPPPPPQKPQGVKGPTNSTAQRLQQSPPPSAASPPAAATQPGPLADLLSLDSWGPDEAPSYPPVSAAKASPVGSAADPFALAVPVAPGTAGRSTWAPAPSNNPFGAPPLASQALAVEPAERNPFLSDSAFGAALQPAPVGAVQPQPSHSAAAAPALLAGVPALERAGAAETAEVAGSGNPFATPPANNAAAASKAADPKFSPSLPLAQQAPYTPPPLQPMDSFAGYPAGQASLGAGQPFFPTASYPGYSFPSASPAAAVSPGPYGRPLSDAFGDLVTLVPKEEPTPPPPRGTPMRTPAGLTPEPSNVAVAISGASDDKSALSAFDAFDELLTTNRG